MPAGLAALATDAVLAGALELPDFASEPNRHLAVKWIPPKWDWVDALKDRKAEIEAIEAGLKSRCVVIESEGRSGTSTQPSALWLAT